MKREQIIRMARETDLVPSWMQNIPEHQLKWIEDFAALVAAAERERLKQSIRHSLTIGPKTIQTRVYFGEVEVSMVQMPIEEVVAAEREACAKLVEHYRSDWDMADTIRARGDKT